MTVFRLLSRQDTERLGAALGRLLRPGDTLALAGALGAGKTTLAQAIARGMGITDPVTSPTFALIQEHPGPVPLFHFDVYRLQVPEEVLELGFTEYLERDGVLLIEWADRIASLLPPDHLLLLLEIQNVGDPAEDAPRILRASATGARSRQLLELLTAQWNTEPAGGPA
ncbi:MAG: tRNA (adenosine(37)-N6)-threonylcarbamoyltransferase complex ATPase subunit type 1 TsaE [Chloroherpetonaceae bacterium]|nr:tRNA (adenosine(37)-N6)-threonylcarbamoyltransferase complex ATPase subunit type 1 TsaE [Chthonomonadaceae bacterium]MDW8208696.1 tRNA (adenosine(37)-N6)-threonylcarbamoyltransferase complex ATPase subunit type 1 TsaE [Chloroherpetonaceae bacterium]